MPGEPRPRPPTPAWRRRPFALPSSLDELRGEASGWVALPLHLDWRKPPRAYNLDDPHDRRILYEIVLREGRPEDLRRYIDAEELRRMFAELYLPGYVREAWSRLLEPELGPEGPGIC